MHLINVKSADPRYYTFKQIKDLDLKLKKGSKGIAVQYFNFIDKEVEKKGKTKQVKIPFVRLTHAFNAQDINGLEPYEQTKGFAALKDDRDLTTKLKGVIKNAGVEISHGGNKAFYQGGVTDEIMMPPPERFSSHEAYAATLLHELAHSTGHSSRQSRNMVNRNDDKTSYAKEELRAELSSVFMCQRLGISYQLENDQTHIKNSAAYLKSWKNILKNDKLEFFKAARDASKITAYLVDGKSFERTLNKANNKQETISNQQINTPVNKDFNNAVDEVWGGKNLRPRGNIIQLGKVPKKFENIGIPDLPIVMKYSKLFQIKNNHNLTPEILKTTANQLKNPAMIFKNSSTHSQPNSFIILTETEDINNKPVIVALQINKLRQNIQVNEVKSIYGRNIKQIENALKHNELVYKHKQKSQLIMSRLQLPSSLLTDSRRIITNESIKSNAKIKSRIRR